MVRKLVWSVVFLLLSTIVMARTDNTPDYTPGVLIVKTADKSLPEGIPGLEIAQAKMGQGTIHILEVKDKDIPGLAKAISKRPGVIYAEPDYLLETASVSITDPLFSEQWALQNTGQSGGTVDADIDAPEAWAFSRKGAIIAIIDTGVQLDHPDLQGQIWVNPGEDINHNGRADWYPASEGGDLDGIDNDNNCLDYPSNFGYINGCVDDLVGYDFVYSTGTCYDPDCSATDNDPSDGAGHGTAMVGIAAAAQNDIGIVGACPNCKIMPLRVCYKNSATGINGACSSLAVAWALRYAVEKNADVVSMSIGFTSQSSTLHDAITYAHDNGLILVAAAGNAASTTPQYPAAWSEVIAVANTDRNDKKWYSSNYGTWIDISAPGGQIMTTMLGSTYNTVSGTSASAPFVSAAAAMLKAANRGLTNEQVRTILKSGSDNIDALNPTYAGLLGAGRLNMKNSICKVVPCSPVLPGKPTHKIAAI
ncbi:MAG: S8 family serine peptidase [Candidatus Woesearchaeota archaeon]